MKAINHKQLQSIYGAGQSNDIYPHQNASVYTTMLKQSMAATSGARIGSSIVGTNTSSHFGCELLGASTSFLSGTAVTSVTKNLYHGIATGAAVGTFVTDVCNATINTYDKNKSQ